MFDDMFQIPDEIVSPEQAKNYFDLNKSFLSLEEAKMKATVERIKVEEKKIALEREQLELAREKKLIEMASCKEDLMSIDELKEEIIRKAYTVLLSSVNQDISKLIEGLSVTEAVNKVNQFVSNLGVEIEPVESPEVKPTKRTKSKPKPKKVEPLEETLEPYEYLTDSLYKNGKIKLNKAQCDIAPKLAYALEYQTVASTAVDPEELNRYQKTYDQVMKELPGYGQEVVVSVFLWLKKTQKWTTEQVKLMEPVLKHCDIEDDFSILPNDVKDIWIIQRMIEVHSETSPNRAYILDIDKALNYSKCSNWMYVARELMTVWNTTMDGTNWGWADTQLDGDMERWIDKYCSDNYIKVRESQDAFNLLYRHDYLLPLFFS